jgi:tetratricopeptide (TPR) repeat protein
MAEELDDESSAGIAATANAMAAQMVLGAPLSPASEVYLRKHGRLLDLQIENLQKQDEYEVSHLRWRRFNDQMRGLLQVMAVAVATLVVVAIAAAVWNAHEAGGVVVEAFSVPPDMAARGLTGEVVAKQVQDRLTGLQSSTYSFRAPSSYANNWGKDIKVQIPDTGVSIGEFDRYLVDWLGHETQITGEIYRSGDGIAVTARAGSDASPTFTGSEADLGKLIAKAAESVYQNTQPYRYAVYLVSHGRIAEAQPILRNLLQTGTPEDRSWAYIGLSITDEADGDFEQSTAKMRQSIVAEPDNIVAWNDLSNGENDLQHDEQALSAARHAAVLLERGSDSVLNSYFRPVLGPRITANIDLLVGDNLGALAEDRKLEAMPDRHSWENAFGNDLDACGALHDSACVRGTLSALTKLPTGGDPSVNAQRAITANYADVLLSRWREASAGSTLMLAEIEKTGKAAAFLRARETSPAVALIDAHLGDLRAAHVLIDKTPTDCVLCLRFRGRIDALAKNWRGAEYWFARAVAAAPSVPFGYADWGAALLAKGDFDGAIAKFESANQKGPHFADPLEMWGEALIAKNRSDLALAKFEEADKYAPNWGRLHLKWGEALFRSDNKDEARKQFGIAGGLDLTVGDKAALARVRTVHG